MDIEGSSVFAYLEQIMLYVLMLNATRSALEEDEAASFYFELLDVWKSV